MAMDKIKYSGYGLAVCTALFSVAAMAGTDADGKVPVPASGVSAAGRHADAAAGQEAPVPRNADEILQNLRDIVERGNLADEQYYSRKLGVVMKEANATWFKWHSPCEVVGVPAPLFSGSKDERALYYSSVPWYFSKKSGMRPDCDIPYTKQLPVNGITRVDASISIDYGKVCITEDDIHKYFKNGSTSESMYQYRKNGFLVREIDEVYEKWATNNTNGPTKIYMFTETSGRKCMLSALLLQGSRKGVN